MFSRRDLAISGYCIQLGMMERLKHELLLLHNKVNPFVIFWGNKLYVLGELSSHCF